ncbi:MAG: hypothetical protein RIS93_864 [Actinomycetota bacterium]|jgi:predicted transcriptional regulator YdeE
MAIKNNGTIKFEKKIVCGIGIDIFSIMMADKYDPSAIPSTWQKFWLQFPKEISAKNPIAFGASIPIETEPGKLHYVAGVEVDNNFKAPSGFETCIIPNGDYLVIQHQGNISGLAESYAMAYGVEFPKAGLEMRPAPHLEVYDSTLNPNSDDYEMKILIPVI